MVTACSWVSHVNLPKGRSMSHQAHHFFPFLFFSLNKKQLIVTVPYVTQQCTKTTIKKKPLPDRLLNANGH